MIKHRKAGVKAVGEEANKVEISEEMIDAGVSVFWDFCEDKFAVTYDARPFVREVFEKMALLQRPTQSPLDTPPV